ncbi:hypothetical protein FGO68_gene16654 [Halteria grandinella]|uniref:Uncharacterized protein n=1 Tax=Halteria grandinella TaxID=5974 RepID=A0A8J8T905_HALGN|nr:hypothetical protein FGO68_gene16654 [Halteria grandinella]
MTYNKRANFMIDEPESELCHPINLNPSKMAQQCSSGSSSEEDDFGTEWAKMQLDFQIQGQRPPLKLSHQGWGAKELQILERDEEGISNVRANKVARYCSTRSRINQDFINDRCQEKKPSSTTKHCDRQTTNCLKNNNVAADSLAQRESGLGKQSSDISSVRQSRLWNVFQMNGESQVCKNQFNQQQNSNPSPKDQDQVGINLQGVSEYFDHSLSHQDSKVAGDQAVQPKEAEDCCSDMNSDHDFSEVKDIEEDDEEEEMAMIKQHSQPFRPHQDNRISHIQSERMRGQTNTVQLSKSVWGGKQAQLSEGGKNAKDLKRYLDQLTYANVKSKLGEQVIFTVSECDENEDSVSEVRKSQVCEINVQQSLDSSKEIQDKSKLHLPSNLSGEQGMRSITINNLALKSRMSNQGLVILEQYGARLQSNSGNAKKLSGIIGGASGVGILHRPCAIQ